MREVSGITTSLQSSGFFLNSFMKIIFKNTYINMYIYMQGYVLNMSSIHKKSHFIRRVAWIQEESYRIQMNMEELAILQKQ